MTNNAEDCTLILLHAPNRHGGAGGVLDSAKGDRLSFFGKNQNRIFAEITKEFPEMEKYLTPELEEVKLSSLGVIAASNLESPEDGDIIEW